jgi:hypothetical protein
VREKIEILYIIFIFKESPISFSLTSSISKEENKKRKRNILFYLRLSERKNRIG